MARDPEDAAVKGTESLAPTAGDARLGLAVAGRYRIISLLGKGDRKSTYLALDTDLEREVALGARVRKDTGGRINASMTS